MVRPATPRRHNRILAWAVIAICFAMLLSVGSARGRLIDWASVELLYTPPTAVGYSSDCLTQSGQDIILTDWAATETQRVLEISVERPPAQSAETVVREGGEAVAEEPAEVTWPQDEVTVTPDEAARLHVGYTVAVEEHRIRLALARLPEAPGLARTTPLTVTLAWQGLSGTVRVNMLPYGEQENPAEDTETTPPEREIDTTLEPVKVRDTISPENPVVCVKLNLQTGSDFHIAMSLSGSPLHKVRWSMDGESYALLYDSAGISIPYPYAEGWDGTVFLDFAAALSPGKRPTVEVEATGYNRQEMTPVEQAMPQPEGLVLKAATMPHIIEMDTRWGAAEPVVQKIERLTADGQGSLTYTEDTSIKATVTQTGIRMESARKDRLPEPGSYRMLLKWIWNDVCVDEQIIYFFVNTN